MDDRELSRNLSFDETMRILSCQDSAMEEFLGKIVSGWTMASSLKAMRTKRGRVKITRSQAKKLSGNRRCNRIVSDIIKEKKNIDDPFSLVSYYVKTPDKLCYEIEMKKTLETDSIMKNIRKLRRNRKAVLARIGANL